MAMQTISIHFAVGETVTPRGTDRIAIGNDVDLFLGFGSEAVRENAEKLIRAAQALIAGSDAVCDCTDPICPRPRHRWATAPLDAIDEAKRAREIAEAQIVEAFDPGDEWTNREGMPKFSGSFR